MTDAVLERERERARRAFVERVATYWSTGGLTHAAGAILGHLMVCDPAAQTQQEIASALGLSAGTVSTQLRVLTSADMVEKVRRLGVRTHFYQIPQDMWLRILGSEDQRIAALSALAAEGMTVLPESRPDRIQSLDQMARFFHGEWPRLEKRLEEFLRKEGP